MHREAGSRTRIAAGVVALALATSLAGCYTLLIHPRAADPAGRKDTGSCLACHEEDGFGNGSVPWVDYYRYSSAPWINYYGSPWWHDSYWYRHDACEDCPADDDNVPAISGRHAWGRRPLGWNTERERERTSPALPPIIAPPAPPPPARPPAAADEEEKPEEEKPEEPRGRALRR